MFDFFKTCLSAGRRKKDPDNLKEVLGYLKKLKGDYEKISRELEALKKESRFFIRKIGIARFNPFPEVGGNQSFSVALLDSNNDGVVITSLYSREGNRVYAKPVEQGKSKYQLSEEEAGVIAQALNSKNFH